MSITPKVNTPPGPAVAAVDSAVLGRVINTDVLLADRGGTSCAERMLVFSIIRLLAPETVLEVGVSGGGATCWIAAALEANRKGHLLSVDNWSGTHGGIADSEELAAQRLKKHRLRHRVDFHQANSHTYLPTLASNSYDLVVIDGDHSEAGAAIDVRAALRIASGFVLVHDTWQMPEVRKVCQSIGGGCFIDGHRGYWLWSVRQAQEAK